MNINNFYYLGISKIFNSNLCLMVKIRWLIFIIILFLCFTLLTYQEVSIYFKYSAVTSINVKRDLVTEFPTITICSNNLFGTKNGNKYLNDLDLETDDNNVYKKSRIKSIQNRLNYARSALLKDQIVFKNKTLLESFSNKLDQMMFSCYFQSKPCNLTDFEYLFDINYGNCYRFNSGYDFFNQKKPIKNVITSGITNGLQIELFLGEQDSNNQAIFENDVYLVVHNKSYKGLLSTDGFHMPTGKSTYIGKICCYFLLPFFKINYQLIKGIKRRFHEKLSSPFSDCVKNLSSMDAYDSELFKRTTQMAGVYRHFYCFKLCVLVIYF